MSLNIGTLVWVANNIVNLEKEIEAGLHPHEVKKVYNKIGKFQEWERFYQLDSLTSLLKYCQFENKDVENVLEIGCGTGSLMKTILQQKHIKKFLALDISEEMVKLSKKMIKNIEKNNKNIEVSVKEVDVTKKNNWEKISLFFHNKKNKNQKSNKINRIISTYTFDSIKKNGIEMILNQSKKLLSKNGKICLINLTNKKLDKKKYSPPKRYFSNTIISLWQLMYQVSPSLMGGCRPLQMKKIIKNNGNEWEFEYHKYFINYGMKSEVSVFKLKE